MKKECIFCNLWKDKDKERVIYENDVLYVVEDIHPCANHHFLVISKDHIKDCNALSHADFELLNEMETVGMEILRKKHANNEIPWISSTTMAFD